MDDADPLDEVLSLNDELEAYESLYLSSSGPTTMATQHTSSLTAYLADGNPANPSMLAMPAFDPASPNYHPAIPLQFQDPILQSILDTFNISGVDYLEYDAASEHRFYAVIAFAKCWYNSVANRIPDRVSRAYLNQRILPMSSSSLGRRGMGVIEARDLIPDQCDLQGINWSSLGTTRRTALAVRRRYCRSLARRSFEQAGDFRQPSSQSNHHDTFYRFRRMFLTGFDTHQLTIEHFQLRHLMAVTSYNDVYFVSKDQVMHIVPWNPSREYHSVLRLKSSNNTFDTLNLGPNVSTMTAWDNVVIAGGINGEYAYQSLDSSSRRSTQGILSNVQNRITNHVHIPRGYSSPRAVFTSNDCAVRTIDLATNKLLSQHTYNLPVNASATQPTGRLRVLVRDSDWSGNQLPLENKTLITEAESGQTVVELHDHKENAFACAWSDDGIHVATGAQDMRVHVYDARWWSEPIATLSSVMGCPRSLKFSPLGGGRPCLAVAEAEDVVRLFDTQTFMQNEQRIEMFGSIGGIDFSPEGRDLFVGNADPNFGGIAQWSRAGDGSSAWSRHWNPDEDSIMDDDVGGALVRGTRYDLEDLMV